MSGFMKKISGFIVAATVIIAVFTGVITGNVAGVLWLAAGGGLAALGFYAVGVHFENQETSIELLKQIENRLEEMNELNDGEQPGTKAYGTIPAAKPGPMKKAAQSNEPWVCRRCGKTNEPQYKACSGCHTPR